MFIMWRGSHNIEPIALPMPIGLPSLRDWTAHHEDAEQTVIEYMGVKMHGRITHSFFRTVQKKRAPISWK